jgi:hypothetical protein
MSSDVASRKRQERQDKERRLAELISTRKRFMVGVVVRLSKLEHREIVLSGLPSRAPPNLGDAMLLQTLRQPAYLAMQKVLSVGLGILLKTEQDRGGDGYFHCIFEDRDEDWQDDVCFVTRSIRRRKPQDERRKIGGVNFVPGKGRASCPPLEAADLLAWHVQRQVANGGRAEEHWDLLEAGGVNDYTIDAQEMQEYVDGITEEIQNLETRR